MKLRHQPKHFWGYFSPAGGFSNSFVVRELTCRRHVIKSSPNIVKGNGTPSFMLVPSLVKKKLFSKSEIFARKFLRQYGLYVFVGNVTKYLSGINHAERLDATLNELRAPWITLQDKQSLRSLSFGCIGTQ